MGNYDSIIKWKSLIYDDILTNHKNDILNAIKQHLSCYKKK